MTSPVLALLLQAAPRSIATWYPLIFQAAIIGAIFYFMLIRPQQKQRKAHEERLSSLKKGDQIVTSGGIVGEVVHIREITPGGGARAALMDHITVKSGESRLVVERGRIAVVNGTAGGPEMKRTAPTA